MADLVAIDISHHQPDPIDWARLKADGIVGVIHKATESTTYKDPKLYERARAAMDAGLKWSTYHFLRPGKMPQQMDWYLSVVDPKQGERMCLDHEDGGVTIGDLEYCVNYLRGKRPDLQITIYSGHVIKEQLGSKTSAVLATTSLWLAQYSSTPSWPTQVWPQWTLWQYTDQGSIPGINGNVDHNRFNGSPENCALWFGPAEQPAPSPEPQPEQDVININMQMRTGVVINFVINGSEYTVTT